MNRTRISQALLVAVIGSVAIVGCKKKEEAVAPPVVTEPAPAPAPAPVAATATVTTVELGNAVGPDMKLTATGTSFKPKDTITVSIGTSTSDPAATVAGKLGVKWSFQDGQVFNEESKDVNLTGSGASNFQVAKPSGFPVGKYKVEVSLDGAVVQTKEFEVK